MKILTDEGYTVTAGVLNSLDTDHETAKLLKVEVVEEAPLSPITDSSHNRNLAMICGSNAVVLTSIPFGMGNIRNLEAVKIALEHRIPTFVIDEVPVEDRDFTQGKAKNIYLALKGMGAVFVKNQSELLHMLNVSDERLKLTNSKPEHHLKPQRQTSKIG
jgi:iron complex transport system ATP-binding protein